jgi:hypothetical protein
MDGENGGPILSLVVLPYAIDMEWHMGLNGKAVMKMRSLYSRILVKWNYVTLLESHELPQGRNLSQCMPDIPVLRLI